MGVRMKDIARDLGVSVVTVSKVIRNHEDIGSETRERVLKRMKELNYQPNLAARALVTGKSHMVGLIVPDLLHPFFAQVAKGLSKVFRQNNYTLFIASSEDDSTLEKEQINQVLARRMDALLVASTQWSAESFRLVEEHKTPYVLLDRQFRGLNANFVGTDDRLAGEVATRHLMDVGCRRIAHIGAREISTPVDRLEGYRQALAERGMTSPPEYVALRSRGDYRGDVAGYDAMKELLRLDARPDGVFCYNDTTAMGAMKAILDANLRIPEDIAVVGCGNVFYADFLRVSLTTVDQSSQAIGEHGAALALNLMNARTTPQPRTILVEPKLVVRQSSNRS